MTVELQRLTALRRGREQRALEALIVQAGLLQRAEQLARETARAAHDQVVQVRARERELIGALCGRTVSLPAILRVQTELDKATLDTARLRAAAARAQVDLLASRRARTEALANFQRRQRATEKLHMACKQEAAWLSRWEAALSDAEHEDHRAAGTVSKLP
jgi:hypothetical protein